MFWSDQRIERKRLEHNSPAHHERAALQAIEFATDMRSLFRGIGVLGLIALVVLPFLDSAGFVLAVAPSLLLAMFVVSAVAWWIELSARRTLILLDQATFDPTTERERVDA